MAGIAGCGGDAGTGPPPPPPPPVAASITVEPASATLAWIGDTQHFAATIRDQKGNALEGAIVWSTGNSSVVTINEGGEATAVSEGTTEIRAAFRGLTAGASVTVEQVAATLEVVSGADQQAPFGTVLAEPVVVMVADSGGHAVADETVVFATGDEGGVATPDTTVTDAGGVAATTWRLGDQPGPQSLSVTVTEGLAATVAATALVPLFPFEELVIPSLDTTVVLPTHEYWGNAWTFDVEEVRWLDDYPVAAVTRRADPPGLVLDVANPGSLVIEGNEGTQRLLVRVNPPAPIVYDVRQESWPRFDDVTLRGYALDRIPLPLLEADGEPVLRATGDSAEILLRLPPAAGGECLGDHMSRGTLRVLGAELRPGANLAANRLKGPITDLEVGEAVLLDGGDICIRLPARRDAAYVLAAVERTYIDEAHDIAEPNRYEGGDLYLWTMADSSAVVGRDPGGAEPVWVSGRQDSDHLGYGDEIRSWSGPGSGIPLADGKAADEHLQVGDEFEYSGGEGRYGTFRVMGVYEPNVVLAVFVADMEEIWHNKSTRQAEMDSLFNYLATPEVQNLYKTIFGPEPPRTSRETGQILVLYQSQFSATGRADPNVNGDPRLVVLRMGHAPWGDENGWYTGLMSHEFAHAWQFYSYGHFAANWSGEGIANLFADEETRISAGLPLDANHDVVTPLRLLRLRLPVTGDFAAGYRESHPFLRYLLQRLVGEHRRPYDESIHRVIKGAAEGWHGIHFVRWGAWGTFGRSPGLTNRMREIIPDWDPVESRLDWMIAFALDDRGGFQEYELPFTLDSWRHFGPWHEFEAGNGADLGGDANVGGQHYYMLSNPRGIPINIRHRITIGEPNIVWKIFRYR